MLVMSESRQGSFCIGRHVEGFRGSYYELRPLGRIRQSFQVGGFFALVHGVVETWGLFGRFVRRAGLFARCIRFRRKKLLTRTGVVFQCEFVSC